MSGSGMMRLEQVASALGIDVPVAQEAWVSGISTDSRTLSAGALFIALRGPSFNGHKHIEEAQQRGAVAAVVESVVEGCELPQLRVANSRIALGALASGWRHRFQGPLVAVTGSNGKTTVKEMLAAIFAQCGAVLSTQGNFNNEIGVPLTLFTIKPEQHQFAVVEMGANHRGEIAYLTHLAQPTVALITNAAGAHLEGFGTLEGVAQAKGEIWLGLGAEGVAVINADDAFADYWRAQLGGRRCLTFGSGTSADLYSRNHQFLFDRGSFQNSFELVTPSGETQIQLQLLGSHNVLNALAAATAAFAAGVGLEQIRAGLALVVPVKGRLQPCMTRGGELLIDDSYNANPDSLNAALEVLVHLSGETVLVMGDMAELGDASEALHRQAGERARQLGVTHLYACGEQSHHAVRAFGAGGLWFERQEAMIEALQSIALNRHTACSLLVKGSRSAAMERVVQALALGGGDECSSPAASLSAASVGEEC